MEQREVISKIECILDFDGFFIGKSFLVREMGFAFVNTTRKGSFTFKVGNFKDLDSKSKRTVSWVTKNINGMRFQDNTFDYPQYVLPIVIKQLADECKQLNEDYVIAFKGGHVEKDVLTTCEIPFFDLEDIGCPKFKDLHYRNKFDVHCKLHKHIKKNVIAHCPQLECLYFKEWLNNRNKTDFI
jgi:hypothetical protein